jgi:carbon-monoxide dehydrogenase medium subunit
VGDTVVRARVHLGAVPDSPRRLPTVEAALEGTELGADTVTTALAAFDAEQVETLGDSHGSAAYRLAMARVQLKRALQEIAVPTSVAQEAVA